MHERRYLGGVIPFGKAREIKTPATRKLSRTAKDKELREIADIRDRHTVIVRTLKPIPNSTEAIEVTKIRYAGHKVNTEPLEPLITEPTDKDKRRYRIVWKAPKRT